MLYIQYIYIHTKASVRQSAKEYLSKVPLHLQENSGEVYYVICTRMAKMFSQTNKGKRYKEQNIIYDIM